MSAFTTTNDGQRFTYGFDRPLSEYFLSCGGRSIVGTLSRPFVYGSAVNLMVALQERGLWDKIPEEHSRAIGSDLPF